MRAAIYARYSSDNQRDASIEDQIRICKERAVREGWHVVEVYSDHAISGASLLRPGIQKLMQDGVSGKFDIVVSEAMDRLSRDQEDIAGFYKRMQFANVTVFTLSEGEISSLHIGLKGTMNALFLKDLAAKTHRGMRGRVEKGKSGGGLTYGYDVVRGVDATGDYTHGERRINDAEANIVRRIFSEHLKGLSPTAIAKQLNSEGIAGPLGGTWGPSTINGNRRRGTGIINNELYVGKIIWNRLRYVKDPSTGKRISRLNEPSEWVVTEAPELRIVDQAVWDELKSRQTLIERAPLHSHNRPRYLLTGLMRCGCCGGGYTVEGRKRVRCANRMNKGTCDNALAMNVEELEASVLSALQVHLMDEALCDLFCKEYTRRMNELRSAHNAARDGYRAELNKLEREREKIISAIAEGIDVSLIKDRANALQKRREELQKILEVTSDEPVIFHPNMAKRYHNAIRELVTTLQDPAERMQASRILRSLIEKVVLTPAPDGDRLVVDLVGDLAGILSIASNRDKAAVKADLSDLNLVPDSNANGQFDETGLEGPSDQNAMFADERNHSDGARNEKSPREGAFISSPSRYRQVVLVAGAGFEPATFRL
ncbi:recombinase family protein [Devosia riboflavina]|uniref:recombinase family protein n=1 Tax=Devosia riboflavina TaxID=46914 RepID=UPI000A01E61B|nr:recombinase family protein [Devosia riboflavina]